MRTSIAATALLTLSMAAIGDDGSASCIYDVAAAQFRTYDAAADAALLRETLVDSTRPEVVVLDHKRFARAETLRGTADQLNPLLQLRTRAGGIQWFGTSADPRGDLVVALVSAVDCAFSAYRYAPIVHIAWVEDPPFVFRFPALAVDTASLRREGDRAFGTGFLMLGHPHPDTDPTVYLRQTIEADCTGERLRVLDTRSFAADSKLHERYREDGEWQTTEAVTHPATRALALVVCDIPKQWPEQSRVQSLDELSEQVHATAHRGG